MKLISEHEFDRLKTQTTKISDAKEHFFHEKAQDAESLLDSSTIPDDIKIQLYGSVMSAVQHQLHEILNKPVNVKLSGVNFPKKTTKTSSSSEVFRTPTGSAVFDEDDEQDESVTTHGSLSANDLKLIETQPTNVRVKLYHVMKSLKGNEKLVHWDEKGRVTFFNDDYVPESNIVDLLNFTTRELKWDENPSGINRFLRVCKMINLPTSLLSKEAKKGWLGDIPPRENLTDSARRSDNTFMNWEPLRQEDLIAERITPRRQSSASDVNCNPRRRHK